jgi:hypothetical protein
VNNPFGSSLSIALVFTLLTIFYLSQSSLAQNSNLDSSKSIDSFVNSFEKLANEAHNLTQSYQSEFGMWKTHQYDNRTMIWITNNYLPKYANLANQSKALHPPKQYQSASDLYTKSLESEVQSYSHFRNYSLRNNSTENELSTRFLSDAFKYEIDSFKMLKSSGLFTIMP